MGITDLFAKLGWTKPQPYVEATAPAEQPVAKPVESFESKLRRYAAHGRAKEAIMQDNDGLFAIKPAARAGDVEFLRELHKRDPAVFARKDYWVLKEGLTNAIVRQKIDVVDFFLNEAEINPEYGHLDRHGRDESYKFPNWDALFVAAVGFETRNFMHEPGTVWQNDMEADPKSVEIFEMVLDAYKEKYEGDPEGLAKAINRGYSLPDGNTFWNSDYMDYRVMSTKSSSATTLDAARPNLKERLEQALREQKSVQPATLTAPRV